jgi:outer membrane protein
MTKGEIRQTVITLVACIITGTIVWWIGNNNQKKMAVVDAVKIFNSYKMKMELEAKAGGKLEFLGHQVDSIKQELAARSKTPGMNPAVLEEMYRSFQAAQARLDQEYQESNQAINEQVWKRLNPQIDEYGKKHGLRLIIGANGMGSVLYNNDFYDHTNEVIEFVNKKYEEGN